MAISDLKDSSDLYQQYLNLINEQDILIQELNNRNNRINELYTQIQANPIFQKNVTPDEQTYFTNLTLTIPAAAQSVSAVIAPTVQVAQPAQPDQPV